MILTAGISGFIHIWISMVRVIHCIRNAWGFSFASVTVTRNPLFLSGFAYHRWGRAAMLWFLPGLAHYTAGKETIDLALGQAGTLSSGILRTQASFPQAPRQPQRTLWDVLWGSTWPVVILRQIYGNVLQVGRLLRVVFHAIGNVHRSRWHWKTKSSSENNRLVMYMPVLHTQCSLMIAGRVLGRRTDAKHLTWGLEPRQGPNKHSRCCFLCSIYLGHSWGNFYWNVHPLLP